MPLLPHFCCSIWSSPIFKSTVDLCQYSEEAHLGLGADRDFDPKSPDVPESVAELRLTETVWKLRSTLLIGVDKVQPRLLEFAHKPEIIHRASQW
jgi:hypothetical protein